MPGLFGFNRLRSDAPNQADETLSLARKYDIDNIYLQFEVAYLDPFLAASHSHLGLVGDLVQPIAKNNLLIWTYGEAQLPQNKSLGLHLIEAFTTQTLPQVLQKLDGYFCAVLYDKLAREVHFISDRFGMKHLYLAQVGQRLAWATEYKYFEGLPHAFSENPAYISSMLAHGYMVGSGARHKDITLLPAATLQTHCLLSGKRLNQKRYWTWANIEKRKLTFDQSVKEVAVQLKIAAAAAMETPHRYAVALSGGIDSRYLFASALHQPQTVAFTFGDSASSEVQIALQVAAKAKLPHRVYTTDGNNWLEERLNAIRKTDGMLNGIDLHFGQHNASIKNTADVLLNGFAGGVIAGGCALPLRPQALGLGYAQKILQDQAILTDAENDFYDQRTDAFNIDIRQRRFTQIGTQHTAHLFEDKRPFLHNGLLEILYGVPDVYRQNYRLYHAALLLAFPLWYNNINWHYTAAPISNRFQNFMVLQLKMRSIQRRLGLLPQHYNNDHYPTWIQQAAFISAFNVEKEQYKNQSQHTDLQQLANSINQKKCRDPRLAMAWLTLMHASNSDKGALLGG